VLLESHRPPSWAFVVPPFEFSTCIYHKRQRFEVALTWLGILKGMTFSVPAGLGSIAGGPEAAARAPSAQAKGGCQNQGKRLYKPHALSLGGEAESWRMSLAPSSQLQWILNPLGHSFKGPPPPPRPPSRMLARNQAHFPPVHCRPLGWARVQGRHTSCRSVIW